MSDQGNDPRDLAGSRVNSTAHVSTPRIGWKPGQSGNPAGRPPGKTITSELRRQVDPEQLAKVILNMAMNSSGTVPRREQLKALELAVNYLDGRPIARRVTANLTASDVLPAGFHELDQPAKLRVLAEFRANAISGNLLTDGDDQ